MSKLKQISLILAAALFIAGFCSSCQRTPDAQPTPLDSNSASKANKNCLDSVVGTYYGWNESLSLEYYNGSLQKSYHFSGPDTIILLKRNDSCFSVTGGHIFGVSTQMKFDTSGLMYYDSYGAGGSVYLKPETDSVIYRFDFVNSTVPVNGVAVTTKFFGRK